MLSRQERPCPLRKSGTFSPGNPFPNSGPQTAPPALALVDTPALSASDAAGRLLSIPCSPTMALRRGENSVIETGKQFFLGFRMPTFRRG
jgi:hypothetical protein